MTNLNSGQNNTIQRMMETHPVKPMRDRNAWVDAIEACFACAQGCTACADACLAEHHVEDLVRCIRLNLDCADICMTTGRLLSRMEQFAHPVLLHQLRACIAACNACGNECEEHAAMHEHCQVCAELCRRCEQACQAILPG